MAKKKADNQDQRANRAGLSVLGAVLVLAALALRLWDPYPVEALRLGLLDLFQTADPRQEGEANVVVLDIDEESLRRLGQWPWPRTMLAEMVDRLSAAGAAAVGFDVIFAEPDRLSPGRVADQITALDPKVAEQLRALPSNDAVFAEALARTRTVVGQVGSPDGNPHPPPSNGIVLQGPTARSSATGFPGLIPNVPEIDQAAQGRGVFSLEPERDGVFRRVPAISRIGENIYPSLSLEMLRVAASLRTLIVRSDEAGLRDVVLPGVGEIPTDLRGRLWPHFSHYNPARYIPIYKAVDGSLAAEEVAGRFVLVGTSAIGLRDIRSTPLERAVPGVEVHRQLLDGILTDGLLHRPDYADMAELAAVIVMGAILVAAFAIGGAPIMLVIYALLAGAAVVGSFLAFQQGSLVIDAAYPALAGLGIVGILTYVGFVAERRQRREIREAFGRYLSPAMVSRVAASRTALALGGEIRQLTVMFCDLRGFTTLSEGLDPQALTALMNRFLTAMTEEIQTHGGTVDKYIGDCIMAFWNAPLDDEHHAANACKAALAMRQRLVQLNAEMAAEAAAEGQPPRVLAIGIGLNSGSACVGNMGSVQRMAYTCLGDSVNLASRLEGQSKTYGVEIVIGEATAELIAGFATVQLDLIKVKGKTEPTRIHALIGGPELAASPDYQAAAEAGTGMLDRYRTRDWDGAEAAAGRLAGTGIGLAYLVALYRERIALLRADPPPEDWDGVFVATSK